MSDSDSDTVATKDETKDKDCKSIEKELADLAVDSPLDTLAFTENEWEVLEAKKAEYENAKAEHTESILEMQADPKDRRLIQRCKHWRLARERLNLEMSLIWERREIRRNFRRDANHPKGIENW
ncbi:hypothetical protein F4781DRAFT_414797 [Annulohypoxylon bovei var. microspora]|nr:hypothetical protein F4781DRAFT_414797 [Annulohypoxylon bovei var. microspora]